MGSVFILDPFFNFINVQRQARLAVMIEYFHEQVVMVGVSQHLQRMALVIALVIVRAQPMAQELN